MTYRIKEYNQSRNWLFPPSIEELIPSDQPVRIVNNVVEKIDLKPLNEQLKPGYNAQISTENQIIVNYLTSRQKQLL